MNLLITGICGFAGSVIARTLLEYSEGLSLVGFDNLSRKGSESNVEPLRSLGIDIRVGDVRDRAFLDTLPKAGWILDCAANPSVLAGVDGSGTRDLVDQNLYGTVNLLELCKSWRAGFTLLSTSRVYSIAPLANITLREAPTRFEPDFPPHEGADDAKRESGLTKNGLSEAFSTEPPVSLYGSTKRCSELMALEYGAAFGFPVWINRCGVLAGGGQFGKADQGIFSYWIHSWRTGRPLKYIGFGGTGKQVRDCLHPRDLVPLLLKQIATKSTKDTKKIISDAFPFCPPVPPVATPASSALCPPVHLVAKSPSAVPLCDPVPLVAKTPLPRIINCSGGAANSMSLLELSNWCSNRFGPSHSEFHISNSDFSSRPFDIPWMVLDSTLAGKVWEWEPSIPIYDVLEEIALHAESNPTWLDLVK